MMNRIEALTRDALVERATEQTAGVSRSEAFTAPGVWTGMTSAITGEPSAWHHHAGYHSYVYIIEGRMKFEFGPLGADEIVLGPGDFGSIPPNLVHREGTLDDVRGIVFRHGGEGPAVVNVEGPDSS